MTSVLKMQFCVCLFFCVCCTTIVFVFYVSILDWYFSGALCCFIPSRVQASSFLRRGVKLKDFFKNASRDPAFSRSGTAFSFSLYAAILGTTHVCYLIFLPVFAVMHAVESIQEVLVTITFFFFSWDSLISAANGLICFLRASPHKQMTAAAYYLNTVQQTLCLLY